MSYVEKVLQPGERVIHVTGLHWLVYLPAIFLLVLGAGAALASLWVTGATPQLLLLVVGGILGLLAVANWIAAALRRVSTELAVTDRRIVFKRGLVRRHTVEMNMSKVESVDVEQSVLGRILGYGTVTVRGTGGGIEPLPAIADPLGFRSHVTAV